MIVSFVAAGLLFVGFWLWFCGFCASGSVFDGFCLLVSFLCVLAVAGNFCFGLPNLILSLVFCLAGSASLV